MGFLQYYCWFIGSNKGLGCAGLVLGLILGPFGIILVLVLNGDRVKCPFCGKLIDKKAIVCPYCQREQPHKNNVVEP
jgi:hypothetical protein